MSKEQHINEPFTTMLSSVVNIIDCFSTVIGRECNLLFSYKTATNNQPLLIMIAVFYIAI